MTKQQFKAELIERQRVTKPQSSKVVWHLAFHVEDESFTYEAGDSLAVWAENEESEVQSVLSFFEVNSEAERDFFANKVDLAKVPLKLVRLMEGLLDEEKKETLRLLVEKHTFRGALLLPVSAFLKHFSHQDLTIDQFKSSLQPLLPRLYSISSSPKARNKKVDLLVAEVTHTVHGEERRGLCSHYLAKRAPLKKPSIQVSVHPAAHFRLPTDHKAPVIMVGPGTGVAPFRAFIQELELARETMPPCWLFFGERTREYDFLHEEFFMRHEKQGTLHLDLAFSRDASQKMYVQHKMWEQRAKVASWISQQKAYLYICGDAQGMAKEVEEMLQAILLDQKVVASKEEAVQYLAAMRKEGRYSKDVY